MNNMFFAGIDPGAAGGVAVIDEHGVLLRAKAFDKMEDCTIADVIRSLCDMRLVSLEKVSAMPKQGVASSFKFGVNYGYIQGVLDSIGAKYILVRPQEWQKAILKGLNRGDKNITKDYCRRKFGIDAIKATPRSTTPHSGICDAICLAEYSRMKSEGAI